MPNPFLSADGAARYAAGRPDVQPLVLERLKPFLTGTALGVDVACGSGQCSVALADLVIEVRAYDISPEMLSRARPHPRVTYALSPAEALPLPDHCADAMTVFMAFHWFERGAFLREARRLLKLDGVLAICNSWFAGELVGKAEFSDVWQTYLKRYPSAERDRRPFDEPEARQAGFSLHSEHFTHLVELKREQLIAYFLTQSNTIAVTDAGRETVEQVQVWLNEKLAPLMPEGEVGEFVFGAEIKVLTRLD
ncbi:class I SAM-dependent methyltransferase [Deinococcus detaillensis]|uniref:Class I SAM-dependent methyltransferase n=1 Tax=Deinococcus detaillensis TaxID=2592048 RepID=A0A553V0X2_9DEIO|nr:class I SAM-dependent methyltransferase [Deinococcus detaillensis]TSA86114.1 class I SAM-dependent methyltransferase [Deinococcus detaillensis]